MAERYDVAVVGSGTAALVAAYKLAQTGKQVVHIACGQMAAESSDPIGLFYNDALAELGAGLPEALTPVIDNRVYMLGEGSGTVSSLRVDQRVESPVASVGKRADVNAWLEALVKNAGVKSVAADAASLSVDFDRSGQMQALRAGDDVYRVRAAVLGEGAEALAGDTMKPDPTDLRRVVTAITTVKLDADKCAERYGLDEGQASAGAILGGMPEGCVGRGWLYTTSEGLYVGVSCVVSSFEDDPEAIAKGALEAVLSAPCLKPFTRAGEQGEITTAIGPMTGYKYLPQLYGDGWVLVGPATRMIDPLRHEASHHEVTQGINAADAVVRALGINDTGSRPLSVYRHMLNDSYVIKNLKAQRNAVEEIERDPSLVSFYSGFVNRWFKHDTDASLDDRRERNKAFFKNLRNERPVWEFAMGMRKTLKILRD